MNVKNIVLIVIMAGIVAAGAILLHTSVTKSQTEYRDAHRGDPGPETTGGTPAPPAGPKWQPATDGERKLAIATIKGQMNAFNRNDYMGAIGYQSAALRGRFTGPTAFRAMIQRGYPQFAHNKSVVFAHFNTQPATGELAAEVGVYGRDGIGVSCIYYLHLENGQYRVAGVDGGHPPMQSRPGMPPPPSGAPRTAPRT